MKRIEFQDLKPGDTFEYEHYSRYSRPQVQMKRDTVKATPPGRAYKILGEAHFADGTVRPGGIYLATEDGQNHHGYVDQPDRTKIVLLLEEGDK